MTKEPFIAYSEVTNEIYIVWGSEKYLVTEQVVKAMQNTGRLAQPTSEDCISRKATLDAIIKELGIRNESYLLECEKPIYNAVKNMPPVTPTQCIATVQFSKEDLRDICKERIELERTHGTCKDCKHWKDSDGVYRRGVDAESKCPINTKEVYEGNFYCKDFKKRGSENE